METLLQAMRTASEMMNSFAVLTTLKLARIDPLATKFLSKKENDGEKRATSSKQKNIHSSHSKEGTPWFQLLSPLIQCIQGDHSSPMY
jgi:hypothetical protein